MKLAVTVVGAALLAAAVAVAVGADPRAAAEVSGRIVDVSEDDDRVTVVVLAIDDEEELSLQVAADTKVSVDGEPVPQGDLWDCLGADARARYREQGGAAILESIAVTWPGDEEPE